MLIDKVLSFYTEQDHIELARLDEQIELVTNTAHELRLERDKAKKAGDTQRAKELYESFGDIWVNQYGQLLKEQTTLLQAIEQRYIDSFNGDTAAILDDVQEIVDATEKEEYLEYQKRLSQEVRDVIGKNLQLAKKSPSKENKARYKDLQAMAIRGYVNCRFFILTRIRVQLNALMYYNSKSEHDKAIAIVEARAEQFYKKPKGATPSREPAERKYTLPIRDRAKVTGGLLTLPTSPTLTLINEVLGVGDLDTLPERKRGYNRNIQLQVQDYRDKDGNVVGYERRISYTKDKTQVSIAVADIRKLDTRNANTKKLLTRILVKANEQAIHNGELTRDKVSFSLRELVGEGQYKNIETARQGFYKSADILTSFKVSGKLERGKKKTIQQGVHAVLFKAAKVDNATCEVYLNELLPWGLIVPYYTGLPDYYFELPDRAAELLEYIFMLARQNTKKIAEQGYFTISYRALQSRLNLPDETKSKNPGRDIKDALEDAIEKIEDKYKKYAPPLQNGAEPDFSLLPRADYNAPIKDYLDTGFLEIHLKGDYAKRFIDISRKTAGKIEAAEKRRERIEDKARAIHLAEAMKRDDE